MLEKLRPYVILLTVLAFSVANVAWAVDCAAMAVGAEQGRHHAVQSTHSSQSHNHHSRVAAEHADCHQAGSADHHTDQHPDDPAKSCCGALACHAAIQATGSVASVVPLLRATQSFPFEYGLKQATFARLDRPPRSADV